MNVALLDENQLVQPYMARLSRELSIPLTTRRDQFRWVLQLEEDILSLVEVGRPHLNPLYIDWIDMRRRYKSLPISRRSPLGQALGRKTVSVIDATAGWGRDTMLLWMMGYEVAAVERSPVIGALLMDGLRRYRQREALSGSPKLTICEAGSFLENHTADCVYLDPMFPPRRKDSALAKRPLRVLRELVGDDNDREQLFELALDSAEKRVVTKRPNYAKPWRIPNNTFGGKLMCYDVYLKNK